MTSSFGIPGGGTITPFATSSARSAAVDLGLTNQEVMDIEGEKEKKRRLRDITGAADRIDPYAANSGRYGPATLSLFNRL